MARIHCTLAGQVAVVGAAFRAGLHQIAAVAGVGAHGAADHPRAAGDAAHGDEIIGVRERGRQLPVAGSQCRAQRFQLLKAAAADRPTQVGAVNAVTLGQVLGRQPSGEAGSAPQQHIEFPVHRLPPWLSLGCLSACFRTVPPGCA